VAILGRPIVGAVLAGVAYSIVGESTPEKQPAVAKAKAARA